MSLGNRIKKVRLNAQKKQDEFAKSIGIKRAWLSSIENNKKTPSEGILTAIQNVYNVDLSIEKEKPQAAGLYKIEDLNKFLAERSLKNEARLDVILEMLAEWAARGLEFFKSSASAISLSHLPIKSVTRQHIKLILDDIQNKRKKWLHGKTFNKNLGAIKKAFNVLKDWEIIDISPAAGLKDMPEVETNKFIPYTDEEKKIIREYLFLNHYRFFTYLMLIYHCGVRPKEILCLQIKDIDLHTQTITINPSIETENSKTKKIRVVPINDFLMPYLREMRLQDYPKSFFVFGSPFNPGEGHRGSTKDGRGCSHPDYFKPSGTKIKRDSVTKFWNKIVIKKLGINKYLYAMKHTGANEKILAGIDLDALRELYGHSSKLMTEKYAKVVKEVYRKQIMEKSPEF